MITYIQAILLPVFLHFLLVIMVGVRMGQSRFKSVSSGETKRADIVLDSRKWPDRLRQLSNNFDNQFQAPMAWYACVALLIATGFVDKVQVVLAFGFLLSRVVHSFIHITTNKLPDRFYAFIAGLVCLCTMWAWFALRLYVIG
jgi:hypothetical protein